LKSFIIFLFASVFLFSNQKKDNIKNMKIWLLTDKLSLTEEQAQKFFPMYKIHEENINENKQLIKKLYEEIDKLDTNSKNDFEDLKSNLFNLEKKNLILRQNFISDMDAVLDLKQRIELINFDQWFKDELKRKARKMHEREHLGNHSHNNKNKRKLKN
tara:strand:+ start:342 stop:815 length:474 start_codon:yes stop_codon:yes gene_type:complete